MLWYEGFGSPGLSSAASATKDRQPSARPFRIRRAMIAPCAPRRRWDGSVALAIWLRRPRSAPLGQVGRDRVDGAATGTVEGALAQVVALHDLLVRSALDVRLVQHEVVQPAARAGAGARLGA